MRHKLFSSNAFSLILLLVIGFDLINSIFRVSQTFNSTPVLLLRCLSLLVAVAALVSFFIVTKYSLSVLKLFIFFQFIILPGYLLMNELKDFVIYSHHRLTIDEYFGISFSLVIGFILYHFFKKYKIDKQST
jgi:hypothetical protein